MAASLSSHRFPAAESFLTSTMGTATFDDLNSQISRPSCFAGCPIDQVAHPRTQDGQATPSNTRNFGIVVPPSQMSTSYAFAGVQSLNLANTLIATASISLIPNRRPDTIQPVQASAPAKRPRRQSGRDEAPTKDECVCPQSKPQILGSPARSKLSRRTSSKTPAAMSTTTRSARTPHNVIERRYRLRLQSELDNLANRLPGWKVDGPSETDIESADKGLKGLSKGSIIAAAAKHIDSLERDNESKCIFVANLQEQIEGLQKLVRCDGCSILRCFQENQMPSLTDLPKDSS